MIFNHGNDRVIGSCETGVAEPTWEETNNNVLENYELDGEVPNPEVSDTVTPARPPLAPAPSSSLKKKPVDTIMLK